MVKRRAKRKIVLATPSTEDALVNALTSLAQEQTTHQESTAPQPGENEVNLRSGEIFEQYRNILADDQTTERLLALTAESFNPCFVEVMPSEAEQENLSSQLQADAETLAHQIFKLAQTERETDLELYLSALNVILHELSCRDAKSVLDHANAFFFEHYQDIIRDRGERPEILSQIVKRTGKETAARLSAIIKGLDVEATAQTLWKLSCSSDPAQNSQALELLRHCTEKQVRAIRQAFAEIPYKIIATEIHDCLSKAIPHENEEDDLESWFLDTTAAQPERPGAIPLDRAVERLSYILNGRTSEELASLAIHYHNHYGSNQQHPEHTLIEDLKRALDEQEATSIITLLAGFNPATLADKINSLLFPVGRDSAAKDRKTNAPYQDLQINKTLQQRFAKRALLRGNISLIDRILNSSEEIEELLTGLIPQQIQAVNQQLRQRYNYEIDPELFHRLQPLNARAKAFQLQETIKTAKTARELFRSIAGLTPRQTSELNTAMSVMSGHSLEEVFRKRLTFLYGRELPNDIETTLIDRVAGNSRWPLQLDLLKVFPLQEESQTDNVWNSHWPCDDQTEQLAIELVELVENSDNDAASKQTSLLQILSGMTFVQINSLERAFFEMTEPQQPLLQFLKAHLNHEFVECLELIFAGYNLEEDAKKILKSVAALFNLRNYPASGIKLIEHFYQQSNGRSLEADIIKKLSAPELSNELLDLLSILYSPQALTCSELLDRFSSQNTEMLEQFRVLFDKKGLAALALERSYDYRYGRLRLHLKHLLSKEVLDHEAFAETILILENLVPQLPRLIYREIQENNAHSLLEILGQHRDGQPVIEEAYNLLFPDKNLRKAIMGMAINIDKISETLLHLEGYYPHDIAEEIIEICNNSHGDSLATEILTILSEPTSQKPNHRIPRDPNWIDEMTHQVRLAFESKSGKSLIATLKAKSVSRKKIELIAIKMFSAEPANTAHDLHLLLENGCNALNSDQQDSSEEELVSFEQLLDKLTVRGERFRERVMEVYDSCYGEEDEKQRLLSDISSKLQDHSLQQKLLKLLQSKKQTSKESLDKAP